MTEHRPEPQRSTHTNAFIRRLLKILEEKPSAKVVIYDPEDNTEKVCRGFRQIADRLDEISTPQIEVRALDDSVRFGWFVLHMANHGDDQLVDYTANDFCQRVYDETTLTGDE